MVPEFDKVCFDPNTPLGEGIAMIKTQFGVHLVQVPLRARGVASLLPHISASIYLTFRP